MLYVSKYIRYRDQISAKVLHTHPHSHTYAHTHILWTNREVFRLSTFKRREIIRDVHNPCTPKRRYGLLHADTDAWALSSLQWFAVPRYRFRYRTAPWDMLMRRAWVRKCHKGGNVEEVCIVWLNVSGLLACINNCGYCDHQFNFTNLRSERRRNICAVRDGFDSLNELANKIQ
jgi:hypothetical protein